MNAKEEFLAHTLTRSILCATLQKGDYYAEDKPTFNLPVNFTPDQLEAFLSSLDFEYDNGYGGQELFGTIWYKDGTWSDRGEYDGSEWWCHNECPPIPSFT